MKKKPATEDQEVFVAPPPQTNVTNNTMVVRLDNNDHCSKYATDAVRALLQLGVAASVIVTRERPEQLRLVIEASAE